MSSSRSGHSARIRWDGLILALVAGLAVTMGGCGEIGQTNFVWFEAVPGATGTVVSQGRGEALLLRCDASGGPVQCGWTVRMLLQSAVPIQGWAQDVTGSATDAGVIEVRSFDYHLTEFTTPTGTESLGPSPSLLVGVGASTPDVEGVPVGEYALIEFVLSYSVEQGDNAPRVITTDIGDDAWNSASGVPPFVQFAGNLPVIALAGMVVPEPVIIINPAPAAERCADGVDNDEDGLVDCDDPDCAGHPNCANAPTLTCPPDLTVECDGAGNTVELGAWLAEATAESICEGLVISNDYIVLAEGCGATGATTVTWTAVDDCGADACAATFSIADTTPPDILGPVDLVFACDESGAQTELEEWLASTTGNDVCGNVVVTHDRGYTEFDCTATMIWTAEDECGNTSTHHAALTIEGDTAAPIMSLNGPTEMTLECGVDSWEDPGAMVADTCDATLKGPTISGDIVDAETPGHYVVTYDAQDLCGHAADQLTRDVEVVDTRPPVVTIKDIVELWPPNHDYATLTLSDCVESVVDECEGALNVDELGTILSIYSDEPENATGDGNTIEDMVILDHSAFKVRVERRGGENGRVYGVSFEISDTAGNTVEETCFVGVPHDESGDLPANDGPGAGYTIP